MEKAELESKVLKNEAIIEQLIALSKNQQKSIKLLQESIKLLQLMLEKPIQWKQKEENSELPKFL